MPALAKANAKPDQLLLRMRATDSASGVSRLTLSKLAATLDTSETQVTHLALARLAREVLPTYAPDDGPLTRSQLAAIRKAEPQGRVKSVKSSLF